MKYAALCLNGRAIIFLGWGLWGVTQVSAFRAPLLRPVSAELAPLSLSAQTEQARVADAVDAMTRMAAGPVARQVQGGELLSLPMPGTEVVGSVQMPERSMSMHLESIAAERQTVMIDNRLVRNGAHLDGGGRLVQVVPNEAMVREKVGKQTLKLPLDDIRVGTLRWADGTPASTATQAFRPGLQGTQPAAIRSLP